MTQALDAHGSSSHTAKKAKKYMPTNKVSAGALAGAITTVAIWAWNTNFMSHPIPAEMAAAFTTIFAFVLSYMVPNAPTH